MIPCIRSQSMAHFVFFNRSLGDNGLGILPLISFHKDVLGVDSDPSGDAA